jgi:hypothetical protein
VLVVLLSAGSGGGTMKVRSKMQVRTLLCHKPLRQKNAKEICATAHNNQPQKYEKWPTIISFPTAIYVDPVQMPGNEKAIISDVSFFVPHSTEAATYA